MTTDHRLRSANASDYPFIIEMARHACVIEDWPLPDPDSEETQSLLPGHDDVAIVATGASGDLLGAVWTFRHDPLLLVGGDGVAVPEVAIAVAPVVRGQGVGGALLDELITRCSGVYDALCLNVHQRNPSARLYERKGFRVLGQGRGRLGVAMRKDLGTKPEVTMRRYPPIEPYESGMLDVDDGNLIYWEVSGNPDGVPALVVHGGPGSGCVPGMRQLFDPTKYRIVLFDQRGCGRSTPHAGDPAVALATNTIDHLIVDMERLRSHLDIERWVVAGWSWGTTLALAYAEQFPERVRAMVLTAVTTTTPREVQWITRDVGRLFPAEWARFREGVPEADRDASLVEAYSRLLDDPDPGVREKAALDWCAWEDSHINLGPVPRPRLVNADPGFRMCFARLVTHYWRHAAWRAQDELLHNVTVIAHIPVVLIQGRLDVSGPPDIAWQLAQAWPAARLHIVSGMGHESGGAMGALGVTALDRFAEL